MRKAHNIITIDATLLHETDKALLIATGEQDENGKDKGTWIPKSQAEYDDGELQLPEWLAEQKGLI